ncbi:uncharacterized protein LOC133176185 [Saccostrea echinata]|uniref:uncharacterized protein LOC133176185 n=1 Tax=Saccostrea echinata TaxID=191078 RepID=UPI002A81D86C|nr:uncharacterized protein LOC133176185 [Saccostrea echinata]
MLRTKRVSKSPYARPGRAQAAAKKAKISNTTTRRIQVTPAPTVPVVSTQHDIQENHTPASTAPAPSTQTPVLTAPAPSAQTSALTAPALSTQTPEMTAPATSIMAASDPSVFSAGTSASCTNINFYTNTPNALNSVSDALGVHVSDSLRQNIFDNAFIHLHKLLPLKPNDEPQQQLAFVNGELVLKPKHKEIKITSIETWTNAFLIFTSIYLTKFPEHIQSILKYINIIRTAAQRSTNLNWLNYDVQFRLKRSRNHTLDWGSVDAELWLLYVTHGQTTLSQQAPNHTSKSPKCFDFNYKGTCGRPYCTYQHACIKCSNSHPLINCRWHNNQPFRTESSRLSQAEQTRQPPSRFQGRGLPPNHPRPLGLGSNTSQR